MNCQNTFTFFRTLNLCLKRRGMAGFTIGLIFLSVVVAPRLPGHTGQARSQESLPAGTIKKARVELETKSSPLSYQRRDFDSMLLQAEPEADGFVLYDEGGQIGCRQATPEEALEMMQRDPTLQLNVLSPLKLSQEEQQQTGLKIILRGTAQLDANPDAKAAFQRAAATWESHIQTPITIVIDVDFGPTSFGLPFDSSTIGGTSFFRFSQGYSTIRNSLISGASSTQELSLYNLLPDRTVPTDIGDASSVSLPAPVERALGLRNPVADPDREGDTTPRIGFNSAFRFDFDPSDGIDPDKLDFDATAVHEIGHALGFTSLVGSATPRVSVWDLFRFRPGTTLDTFTTAPRILSPGGQHMFFVGGPDVPLSTARNDGTGGDFRQASHWKDDLLIGQYIGIMDPTIARGERQTITDNDLSALDVMGYTLRQSGGGADVVDLTSEMPQSGSISSQPSTCLLSTTQYRIQVPSGASQLNVGLSGDQDVDLYVRFNQQVTLFKGVIGADYKSDSTGSMETVTITPTSVPPLQSGAYFIAVTNCGPGAANFTLTATVGPAGPPPPDTIDLTSGMPQMGSISRSSLPNICVLGPTQYRIQVPSDATQLKVDLSENQDVDLFVRFGQRVTGESVPFAADYRSQTITGTESITISSTSTPPLQQGTYFIAVANCSTSTATFTVTATISSAPPSDGDTIDLTSGVPQMGSIAAPLPGRLLLGSTQYRIDVSDQAVQLKIDLVASGNQDIDLFVRFGQRVTLTPQGIPVAEHRSEGATGNESITITRSSSLALRTGTYYIAVGNLGPGAANFTVTATVSGGGSGVTQIGRASGPTHLPLPTRENYFLALHNNK